VAILRETLEQHAARGGAVAFTTHQDPGMATAKVIDLDA
jgi:ABC-type transport system involved in cytochrome c biogenesis ATPase subunit